MLAKTKTYRPTDKEPFMNERQRDYFRVRLLTWKEEILKRGQGNAAAPAGGEPEPSRSRRSGLVGNRPRHRAAGPRPSAQADRQDRRSASAASTTAATAIARRPASRSRCADWKPVRSRRCRSKRRSVTSAASASTATTDAIRSGIKRPALTPAFLLPEEMRGLRRGSRPEAASFTPSSARAQRRRRGSPSSAITTSVIRLIASDC